MRVAALVVLAGCGRINFDDSSGVVNYLISGGTTASLFVVNGSTGELVQVDEFTVATTIGALAAWDRNTLYAIDTELVMIDVPTKVRTPIQPVPVSIDSLARVGDELVGLDDDSDELVTFVPGGAITRRPLVDELGATVNASGGDLVEMSDGTVFMFSNATQQLHRLVVATGTAIAIGAAGSGLQTSALFRDDEDRLYLVVTSSDAAIELDAATGQLGAFHTLCVACPVPYDISGGDAATTRR